MNEMSDAELIHLATEVLNPVRMGNECLVGTVGAALITAKGNVYRGVSIGAGLGFCAERTAIAQMLTHKEYEVRRIVAVRNDNPEGKLHVLPPCGACRQFMFMVCKHPLSIEVVLGIDKRSTLAELLPNHEWPEPLEP